MCIGGLLHSPVLQQLSIVALSLVIMYVWFLLGNRGRKNLPPGPLGLPIIGHLHLLLCLPHRSLFNLSRKYGPVMTIKLGLVPTIVVSTKEAAKEFLTTHDLVFASRPMLISPKYICYNTRDIACCEYGPYWRQMKKICMVELFTTKRIKETKKIRSEELSLLLNSIANEGNQGQLPVNMKAKLSMLTMNVITRMAFSKKFSGSSETYFVGVIQEAVALMGAVNVGDYIPFLSWLDPQGYIPRMQRTHKQLDEILQKVINEHRAKQTTEIPDLVDVLLSLGGIDDNSIKAVILDMLAGGTDSSAITTEWALSELINNQACLLKAQEEMDNVVGRDRLVSESDLQNLHYLKAVVKETFRLHPAAPLMAPHKSTQECTVRGYRIPKKTWLMVNVWSIGRDPCSWDSPNQFNPERFVGSSLDVKGQDFELIPFGSGRRMCAGMSLAMAMVELTLAHMLQGFEWRGKEKQLNMEEARGVMVRRKVPLNAFATPRLPLHLYNN